MIDTCLGVVFMLAISVYLWLCERERRKDSPSQRLQLRNGWCKVYLWSSWTSECTGWRTK